MSEVKLKKPMHPAFVLVGLLAVTAATSAVLYTGIPGTEFHGMQTGIFFPIDVDFADARFMDNKIVCKSTEVTAAVRTALLKVKPDYPVQQVSVELLNYPSGYKFSVHYVTYYGQKLDFSAEKYFRRGVKVGDPVIDGELKARDDVFEKTIRDTIEAYFKSKGAQG